MIIIIKIAIIKITTKTISMLIILTKIVIIFTCTSKMTKKHTQTGTMKIEIWIFSATTMNFWVIFPCLTGLTDHDHDRTSLP